MPRMTKGCSSSKPSLCRYAVKRSGVVTRLSLLLIGVTLYGCGPVPDASIDPPFDATSMSPLGELQRSDPNPLNNLYWGDLHIHTALSSDAFLMGVRAMPEDAYRFARGDAIEHAVGYGIQAQRPLDFAAVTDHSEFLGQARETLRDIPTERMPLRALLTTENQIAVMRYWWETISRMKNLGFQQGMTVDPEINRRAWRQVIDAADAYNEPGRFSALIGWEWSAWAGDLATHLHRNVIYRDERVSERPFSALDGGRPEDLWAFLDSERGAGRHVLAIPHNSNQSKGLMYQVGGEWGLDINDPLAQRRSEFEPVSEILQIKGASETHPLLSPLDEFADYEIASMIVGTEDTLDTVRGGYARDALLSGLAIERTHGFNPFQFGVIGSSDSHNASSPSDESDYSGKLPVMDGSAGLRTGAVGIALDRINPVTRWSSGGLAAVWARENTREAIFDALQRRETYATSGPRIAVRFFAGAQLDPEWLQHSDGVAKAYQHAVPMGGKLQLAEGERPEFLVQAAKDPLGANLDRIQLVKGWIDTSGRSHETIYDLAWSDGRVPDERGVLPSVANTVDAADASYRNDVGEGVLNAWWQDPEFDPLQPSVYYVRVLEIPTPRWSTFDAVNLGNPPMDPVSIQERAISSPIWYAPSP